LKILARKTKIYGIAMQSAALWSTGKAKIMPADRSQKLGVAIGAAAQELQSARKMAFVGGHDQR
jgi:hypothetical protein